MEYNFDNIIAAPRILDIPQPAVVEKHGPIINVNDIKINIQPDHRQTIMKVGVDEESDQNTEFNEGTH